MAGIVGLFSVRSLVNLLICQIEIYLFYHFFRNLAPEKRPVPVRVAVVVSGAFILFAVNQAGNPWLNMGVSVLVAFAVCRALVDLPLGCSVAYVGVAYVILSGLEGVMTFAVMLVADLMDVPFGELYAGIEPFYLIAQQLLRMLFIKIMERYVAHLPRQAKESISWQMVFVPFTTWMVMLTLFYLGFPASLPLQIGVCLSALCLYLVNFVVYLVIMLYSDIMLRNRMRELSDTKSVTEQHAYEHLRQVNERYQSYIHDMDGYMRTLRVLAEGGGNDSVGEILGELSKIEAGIREETYSANPIFDAIVRERMRRAKEWGVDFSVNVEAGADTSFVEDVDLIAMLGNLLDNGLEGAGGCEGGWLKLAAFWGTDHFLVLRISNSFAHPLKKLGPRFLSTKEESGIFRHGLGIDNVRRVAEKYAGYIEVSEKDHVFTATLSLSVEERQFG
ncbi:MAG: GHKL domain-containing protein [Lachnospiraceae bacterium]|jgi:hypothetical protein|nr:GHKL domain-containing protein [Lachnospiraceae bacterium]